MSDSDDEGVLEAISNCGLYLYIFAAEVSESCTCAPEVQATHDRVGLEVDARGGCTREVASASTDTSSIIIQV